VVYPDMALVTSMLMAHTAVVLAAVLLDLVLGDPRWLPHPVVFMGRLITTLEKDIRRIVPFERAGGVLLLLLTVIASGGLAFVLVQRAYDLNPWSGFAFEAVLAWTCLAARSLHLESKLVADALEQGNLTEARRYLSYIVGRDTDNLDKAEIWRAVVETVAENSSDGVIAPLFFLMLGGAPLAIAYKAVNTLDSMVGYKNEHYLHFGWASARCDDLVNWLPARLTGLLMVCAALFTRLNARKSWWIMARDGRNHSSPNSGVPEAAAAGALGVQLGGTNLYFGKPVVKPTIGDGDTPVSRAAYDGVVRLMYGAELLLVAVWLVWAAIVLYS
jgi:adenosylcobinamide-phosphate synthase